MGEGRQRQRQTRDQRAALFLRFRRAGMTFGSIAQAYGISPTRVRHLVLIAERNEAGSAAAPHDR
jgi:predicted transcriptional regulator